MVEEQGDTVIDPGEDQGQLLRHQPLQPLAAETEGQEHFLDRLDRHLFAPLGGGSSAGAHRWHDGRGARARAFVEQVDKSLERHLQPFRTVVQAALHPDQGGPVLGCHNLQGQPDLVLDHLAG